MPDPGKIRHARMFPCDDRFPALPKGIHVSLVYDIHVIHDIHDIHGPSLIDAGMHLRDVSR